GAGCGSCVRRSRSAGATSRATLRAGASTRPEAALRRRAGDELRRLSLLPRRRVRVQRSARGRPVDHAHESAVLLGDPGGVALLDRGRKALRQRLDRRAVAEILRSLPLGDPDALLLLLDVRHGVKTPASRARRW